MTTETPRGATDEGGEAPCHAHLFDEQPLEVTNALLATLVRQLGDAVLVCDRDGRIVFWNDAATRLFGWDPDEAVGQGLDLIIPERLRQRHWDGWQHVMRTGVTKYGDQLLEVPANHRDGRRLSIAFTVALLKSATGAVDGIAAVIRDDTERFQQRRAAREELETLRAELAAARGHAPGTPGADPAAG
jgi:PAS domain S-box-containing protein